jgi:hypothetical protein
MPIAEHFYSVSCIRSFNFSKNKIEGSPHWEIVIRNKQGPFKLAINFKGRVSLSLYRSICLTNSWP